MTSTGAIDEEARAKDMLKGMDRDMRLSVAITSMVGRIALHGTTMNTHQVIDVMGSFLETHRLASALGFMEKVIFDGSKPRDPTSVVEIFGEAGIGLFLVYVQMVDEFNAACRKSHNLMEMAVNAEVVK